jgi:hypothetical protein
MKDNVPLEQTLCLKYCSYYKPGINEELACNGYMVVDRLLREGKRLVLESNGNETTIFPADRIVKILCLACDFHEQDCDFMHSQAARPCGGFVFLAKLLGSGVITMEDVG